MFAHHLLPVFVLGAAGALLPAQSPCLDTSGLAPILANAVTSLGLRGISHRVDRDGALLFEKSYGSYNGGEVLAIASATKNLSAALLMTLVDEGRLRLDDRVSHYVPSFTGTKAAITVRQCFSHSSGLPGEDPVLGNSAITLAQAADAIAQLPMIATPGTAFAYGGVSMHVVGRVCEVATGKPWATLFQERIAGPLGLSATDYYAFGITQNPRIAGGARSTLRDYARFLDLLRGGGVFQGRRILSQAAVDEMCRNQVAGLRVISTPHVRGAPYGIGTWLEEVDALGRGRVVSGAGAFGFSGWVDFDRGASGTIAVLDRYPRIADTFYALLGECQSVLPPRGVTCVGGATPSCSGLTGANASAVPYAGSAAFAILGRNAPPSAQGVIAVGPQGDPAGTALAGIVLHLVPSPALAILPVASDAHGACRISAPLTGLAPGHRFAAQFVWRNTPSCGGGLTLAASQAVDIVLQP